MTKANPIPEMCAGCARDKGTRCEVISDPGYIHDTRETCFAWVNARQAKEIEKELAFMRGESKRRPDA